MQVIVRCANLDFAQTFERVRGSKDFSGVLLESDPYGNFSARLSVDQKVKVQVSPKGTITIWFPSSRGTLFWFKCWERVEPSLCTQGEQPLQWKYDKALDIGGKRFLTPDKEMVVHILALEELGKLPPDHTTCRLSEESVDYLVKFFTAASDWESPFPPEA